MRIAGWVLVFWIEAKRRVQRRGNKGAAEEAEIRRIWI